MLWLALVCFIVGAVMFVAGLVLFTNGAGVAPVNRTPDDPTGFKRATARLDWRDLYRLLPRSPKVMLDEGAERGDRLMALGSAAVLVAVVAWLAALLAFITGLL